MISEDYIINICKNNNTNNPRIAVYNGYKSKIYIDCEFCNTTFSRNFHIIKKNGININRCSKCIKYNEKTLPNVVKNLGYNLKSILTLDGCKSNVRLGCECGNFFDCEINQLPFRRTKFCKTCIEENKKNKLTEIERVLLIKGVTLNSNNYTNNKSKIELKCKCGNIFKKNYNDCIKKDSSLYLVCDTCRPQNSSIEKKIECLLLDNNISFIKNDRTKIKPLELDFVIGKTAIEINGLFWHSELSGKDNKYHLNKTNLCKQNGISLLHFFESEILNKEDIVKSIILNKINIIKNKIHARKCEIKYIDKSDAKLFLRENHIQGDDKASVYIALLNKLEIVSVMSFNKNRYSKKYQWELSRFCSKLFTVVNGGASKLLNFFIKNHDPVSIGSYSDKRISCGNLYKKLGFTFSHDSKPSYFYFKTNDMSLIHRKNFQKKYLKNKLNNYDKNLTEWQNMINNNYNRIWDCGHSLFLWRKNDSK